MIYEKMSDIAKAQMQDCDIGNMLRECLAAFEPSNAAAPDSPDIFLPFFADAVTADVLRDDVSYPSPSLSLRRGKNGLVGVDKF